MRVSATLISQTFDRLLQEFLVWNLISNGYVLTSTMLI